MEKIVAIFWLKKVWSRHIYTIDSWRSPEQRWIKKILYFPVWHLAKFGSVLLYRLST
jgi:hypothetical protein